MTSTIEECREPSENFTLSREWSPRILFTAQYCTIIVCLMSVNTIFVRTHCPISMKLGVFIGTVVQLCKKNLKLSPNPLVPVKFNKKSCFGPNLQLNVHRICKQQRIWSVYGYSIYVSICKCKHIVNNTSVHCIHRLIKPMQTAAV